jgi:hypothetical protein
MTSQKVHYDLLYDALKRLLIYTKTLHELDRCYEYAVKQMKQAQLDNCPKAQESQIDMAALYLERHMSLEGSAYRV